MCIQYYYLLIFVEERKIWWPWIFGAFIYSEVAKAFETKREANFMIISCKILIKCTTHICTLWWDINYDIGGIFAAEISCHFHHFDELTLQTL